MPPRPPWRPCKRWPSSPLPLVTAISLPFPMNVISKERGKNINIFDFDFYLNVAGKSTIICKEAVSTALCKISFLCPSSVYIFWRGGEGGCGVRVTSQLLTPPLLDMLLISNINLRQSNALFE